MAPAITVIMLMPHSFARLAKAVGHLQQQTIRREIEVVLVHAPGATQGMRDDLFNEFHSFRSLELPGEFKVAEGYALAFEHSTAPVVAYLEDHVTFNPEWAEAIVAAHQEPCAVVAPAMENGNHPGSWIGKMTFLMGFVDWYGPAERSEVTSGPGHNTTYKRAVLERHRDRLAELYQSERNLCYLLESEGHRMLVEPRAVTRHVNISRLGSAIAQAYCGGKIFGFQRARGMSGLERVARTLAAPLVPPLRLWRMASTLGTRGKLRAIGFVSLLPGLLGGLVVHAFGEVAGYWGNAREAENKYRQFELDRLSCVSATDRELLLPSSGQTA